ncbi:anaphase-promoting complex subunit 10 isoform X5 [Prionailurus viverrinus]|uniref:anaphase-promoting complex subunit 10 isoform X5 n=1 Tax=Prionailurus viverrinus TaxID=61388 RepID=UPI001FF4F5A0|nr:anaphase-promoting complex subunit 10 isoform X5 [Prionailurus viverrinus]
MKEEKIEWRVEDNFIETTINFCESRVLAASSTQDLRRLHSRCSRCGLITGLSWKGSKYKFTQQLELVEPSGWIHVPLTDNHKKPTRTFMIQIAVLANHQNGRDTHMRQIKIYTPVEESSIGKFPRCTTIDFMMYRSIR